MEGGGSSGCAGRGAGPGVAFVLSPYGLEVWTPGFPAMGEGTPTPVLNVYLMRVTLSLLKATLISLILFYLPTPPLELQRRELGWWDHGWGRGASSGCVMPTAP